MTPKSEALSPERIAAFFQKHRTGLVTLVFTDLVDSTALLRQLGDQAGATFMQRRRQLIRETLRSLSESEEIETAGDSFLLAFAKPSDAVRFSLQVQARLRTFSREAGLAVQERIGIHLGEVVIAEHETESKAKDLYGLQLATCARVMSLADGGQVLMSRGVFDSARQVLKGEDIVGVAPLEWLNHGPYLLKGLDEPEEVCEVREVGGNAPSPPTSSDKAQRQVRADEEPVLGWRPAIGQLVPNTNWQLEQKLGEGGFGEVWLGRHQSMKERRVFKFCFRADRVRSLKREMTLFRLIKERFGDHPNIVGLREVYLDQPPYYVEEEYVAGADLRGWCEAQGGANQLALELKLEIVAQVADALQAAHDAGVIHRDVKPANILVVNRRTREKQFPTQPDLPNLESKSLETGTVARRSDGMQADMLTAKLADFGIGQVVSQEYLAGVTKAGFTETMLGSPSSPQTGTHTYMAPELLAGKPASTRSDIYSLGVVLYQLLVGDFTRPVTTDWDDEIDDPVLRDDLRRCFSNKANDRFSGAAQLSEGLRHWKERREQATAIQRSRQQAARRRKLLLAGGGVVVVLILVALALGYGLRQARLEESKARSIAYASDMNVAWHALKENNLDQVMALLEAQIPNRYQEDLRHWEWRYLWDRCRGEQVWELGPFAGSVVGLQMLNDGRFLAANRKNQIGLRLCNQERRQVEVESRSVANVSGVALSPDGRLLAVAAWDNIVRLVDVRTLEVSHELHHDHQIWHVAFSPDGMLLSGQGNEDLSVWEVSTHKLLWSTAGFDEHGGAPFLANGQALICYSREAGVALLNPKDGKRLDTIPAPGWPSSLMSISKDGRTMAFGTWGGAIVLLDLFTRQNRILHAHKGTVEAVAFSPDGSQLASGGDDRFVKLWDLASGKELATFQGHRRGVMALAYSADAKWVLSGADDGTVRFWNAQAKADSKPQPLPRGFFTVPVDESGGLAALEAAGQKSLSRNGRFLAVCNTNLVRRLINLETRQASPEIPFPQGFLCLSIRPDGRELAAATGDGWVRVWDVATSRESWHVQMLSKTVNAMEFSPDGARLATAASGGEIGIWDPQHRSDPIFSRVVGAVGYHVNDLVFTPDNAQLLVPNGHGIRVLDLRPNGSDRQLEADELFCLAVSRDGRFVAGGSRTLQIWERSSYRSAMNLRGSLGAFTSVSFSPDSRRIVASDNQGVVWLWDLATGRELGRFDGIPNPEFVAFHDSGKALVITEMRAVQFLEPPSWKEIASESFHVREP